MEFVILDLEWDNSFFSGSEIRINEIIEFGAVKFDESFNIIDEFSALVKPKAGNFVSGRTKRLTHLTGKMLRKEGESFDKVLSRFKAFLGDATLMTWSTSDIITLMENNKFHYGTNILDYIKSFVDVQKYCQDMMGKGDPAKQMGLSLAAEILGIDQDGIEHHRALDDSLLTLKCFRKLYDSKKIEEYIQDSTNPDFYKRLAFKSVALTDIDNPAVDKSKMYFNCPLCSTRLVKKGKWSIKNKFFNAEFICPKCKEKFCGRIQFRLKFDSVEVKKKIAPKLPRDGIVQ